MPEDTRCTQRQRSKGRGAAEAAKPARIDLVDDRFRRHRQRPLEAAGTAGRQILLERGGRIAEPQSALHTPPMGA